MTSNDKLIVEARSFLGGAGKATLLGRVTDALEKLQYEYNLMSSVADMLDYNLTIAMYELENPETR